MHFMLKCGACILVWKWLGESIFLQLIVESDSKILIDMVTKNCNFSGSVPILVQHIRKLMALDWRVQFRHAWREDNRCADWLANFNFSLDSFNCIRMENLSSKRHRLFFYDISDASIPRNVRLIF